MLRRRRRLPRFQRLDGRRYEHQPLELKGVERVGANEEMPDVRRVKTPPEDAETHASAIRRDGRGYVSACQPHLFVRRILSAERGADFFRFVVPADCPVGLDHP